MKPVTEKLSKIEQKHLLNSLLEFDIDDDGVITDDEGFEFYGKNENDKFDLSTLKGITVYIEHRAFDRGVFRGKRAKERAFQEALGIAEVDRNIIPAWVADLDR